MGTITRTRDGRTNSERRRDENVGADDMGAVPRIRHTPGAARCDAPAHAEARCQSQSPYIALHSPRVVPALYSPPALYSSPAARCKARRPLPKSSANTHYSCLLPLPLLLLPAAARLSSPFLLPHLPRTHPHGQQTANSAVAGIILTSLSLPLCLPDPPLPPRTPYTIRRRRAIHDPP